MSLRKEIYEKMVHRAAPLFGMKPEDMTEETRFAEDCNAKSTHISQITTYLEDEFDTEIPFMSFRRQKTIGDAVNYILTECLEEELEEEVSEETIVDSATTNEPKPVLEVKEVVGESVQTSTKSDHDDELASRERFTLKETFCGEEIEAIYMVARKPVSVDPNVDLSAAEDPMARMGQGFCPAFNQRVYEAAPGILCEQDVPVKMRDGVTIYTD